MHRFHVGERGNNLRMSDDGWKRHMGIVMENACDLFDRCTEMFLNHANLDENGLHANIELVLPLGST